MGQAVSDACAGVRYVPLKFSGSSRARFSSVPRMTVMPVSSRMDCFFSGGMSGSMGT